MTLSDKTVAEINAIVSGLWIPPSLVKADVVEHLKRLFGDTVSDVDYEVDTGTVILTPAQPMTYLSTSFLNANLSSEE